MATCAQTLKGHTSHIHSLVYIYDNSLASGSYDKTIKIWNITTGECIQTLEGHTFNVCSLVYLGDDILASGSYDGTYYEDYEYIPLQSELDECGGRYGITPEYPNGTYYYVLTDNWPYIPRCFKGKFPDNSFRIGPNCPASSASTDCSNSPIVSVDVIQVQTQIELNVYPNPASTLLKLKIEDDLSNHITRLAIYNSNAQIVYSSRSFKEIIQIGNLPQGIYFVQLDFEKDQITSLYFSELQFDKNGAEELTKVYSVLVPVERHNEPEIIDAKNVELENWSKFQAYTNVEDNGQERITTRWVINEKEDHDGLKVKVKARLCLRGFQETEKPRSDSPTASKEIFKSIIAITANESWKLELLDVTAAFLQGAKLEREIFVEPPKD